MSAIAGVELVGRDDLHAQRQQGDRDHLEVGKPERNPDDRQAEQDSAGQMADLQPPADEDDPEDVADQREKAKVPSHRDGTAERPQHVRGDPPRRDAERDRDDQDESDDPGQRVQDRHPPAAQDEPDQVEDEPHDRKLPSRPTATRAECPVRPAGAGGEGVAAGRTSSAASRRDVVAAISSTAASNAAALRAAGARNPLIFLTYCSAAARTSWSLTCSAYGGRKVLILRHILRTLCSFSRARLRGPDGGSRSIESQQRPDAYGNPGRQRGHAADREQHTWHERGPIQRIVPDRQRLPVPAEQYLLM